MANRAPHEHPMLRLKWKPARRSAGRVVLHVGRNKAGSTTIQEYCLAHRAALLREGVRYVLFGHLADSVPGVDGFPYVPQLAEHARAHPAETILVSNEFMFGWDRDYTRDMARDLAGLDVRILAYIRPYASWVRSSYAQEVRAGRQKQDFDAYVEFLTPLVSAWRFLVPYGEYFGAQNVRVKALDEDLRRAGGLIADFRAALGLRPDATDVPVANAASHWAVLEMLRALVPRQSDIGWPDDMLAMVEAGRPRLEECAVAHSAFLPEPAYPTAEQISALNALYDQDLARIATLFGMRAAAAPPGRARTGAPPSWRLLPAAFLRDAAASVSADPFTAPLGAAIADLATEAEKATECAASPPTA